jgi:Zn-dependent metalloprotease
VDDGEDEDIVWHELGHAIHDDQVPGFGVGHDAGSIGEGFGDYWAVTMSQPINDGYQVPCVGDWDAVSYTPGPVHCLRRTDTNKTVEDQTGEIHDDGEIWSRALWDMNRLLGRDRANTVILEAQFSYSPATSWEAAARTTVATARALYGPRAARRTYAAFWARGIL